MKLSIYYCVLTLCVTLGVYHYMNSTIRELKQENTRIKRDTAEMAIMLGDCGIDLMETRDECRERDIYAAIHEWTCKCVGDEAIAATEMECIHLGMVTKEMFKELIAKQEQEQEGIMPWK